ncbi:hypothetical protein [Massilia sp. TWR1-2-2]|uniref:hypothetical protein n=1 Tax=Massilia sp. TWR1-2-2 TaxID=2804584 RepID=UPI003CF9E5DC
MAQYGEWTQKGATLGEVTAQEEYGMSRELIIAGIEIGTLEYRDGAVWGNPYLRLLRSQLEAHIAAELGAGYLANVKNQAELRVVQKEIAATAKKLMQLQTRRTELEASLVNARKTD